MNALVWSAMSDDNRQARICLSVGAQCVPRCAFDVRDLCGCVRPRGFHFVGLGAASRGRSVFAFVDSHADALG